MKLKNIISSKNYSICKLGRFLERTLAIFGLLSLIYFICFEVEIVVSDSMTPILQGDGSENSDWILQEKLTYRFRKPRRWELVAFIDAHGRRVLKRVVGLPGEKIALDQFDLRVDDQLISKPEALSGVKYYSYGNLYRGKEVACGDGYYVLGDASKVSDDSRFEGVLPEKRINARPCLRIWPPSRWGFLNP